MAALQRGAYSEPALVPACPWLSTNTLAKPTYFISDLKTGCVRLNCNPAAGQRPKLWLLQARLGGNWHTEIIPSEQLAFSFKKIPDVIAVTPIDRASVAGKPLVLEKRP
jgi:hypothetical protein